MDALKAIVDYGVIGLLLVLGQVPVESTKDP